MARSENIDYSKLFTFTPDQAACKNCAKHFVFHPQRTGYSTIRRHAETKHEVSYKRAKLNADAASTSTITAHFQSGSKKPETEAGKIAFMICCSQHVLPLSWVDDPIVKQSLGISVCSKIIRSEICSLYDKTYSEVTKIVKNATCTLALDGWKNPITQTKHLSFYVIPVHSNKPYLLEC